MKWCKTNKIQCKRKKITCDYKAMECLQNFLQKQDTDKKAHARRRQTTYRLRGTPISDKDAALVKTVLSSPPHTSHTWECTFSHTTLSYKHDLFRFNVGEWLNDNIIFGFLKIVEMSCKLKIAIVDSVVDLENRTFGVYKKKGEYKNKKFEDYDMIVIPINHGRTHWTCLIVYPRLHTMEHFDSLGNKLSSEKRAMYKNYCIRSSLKKNTWRIIEHGKNTPQQENGYDCGVFVCMLAESAANSEITNLVWVKTSVSDYRKRILLALLIECAKSD